MDKRREELKTKITGTGLVPGAGGAKSDVRTQGYEQHDFFPC